MKYRKGDETEKARVLGISRMQLWRYRQYMDRFRKGAPTEHGASGRKPNSDMWKAIQALDNQFDKKNRDARKREAKLKAGGDRAQESRRR